MTHPPLELVSGGEFFIALVWQNKKNCHLDPRGETFHLNVDAGFKRKISRLHSKRHSYKNKSRPCGRLFPYHGFSVVSVPGTVGSLPQIRALRFQNSTASGPAFLSPGSGGAGSPLKAVMMM